MNPIKKSVKIDVRLTPVQRGFVAELAGPHGSLSSVIRLLVEQARCAAKKGRAR